MKNEKIWDGSIDPDTKAWERGVGSLADSELLAIILRTGASGKNATQISSEVLARGGRQLLNLCEMEVSEFMAIEGIGRVKALQLKAVAELSRRIAASERRPALCLNDSSSIAGYYMETMRHRAYETVVAAAFDVKGGLLADKTISVGTMDRAMFSPREIFAFALKNRARFVIVLHNHPSGNPSPSEDDDLATGRIFKSGEILGITLLDHIIIGDNVFYSYREHFRLETP